MKVLFVWDSEYPWDIRVEKICDTLLADGSEVHLVCRNKSRKILEENYNGVQIHRLPYLPKRFGRLNHIFTFPLFLNPLWLSRIAKVVRENKIELIIVRDLPMALAAIMIGKIKKVPVLLDMAECYPELIKAVWKFEPFKLANVIVRNPLLAEIIEKLTLLTTDHIFVVVEESRKRLIEKGVPPNKITIVSNTPVIQRFTRASATFPGLLANHKGKLILLYVGFLNFPRGLETVVKSMRQFVSMNDQAYLLLIGTGTAETYLKDLVVKLNLEKYVGFGGWIENKYIPEYVASSDICIVPHYKCGHWNNTIPNKLFDYMVSGKPVLVSDVPPMKRIVEEANCGLIYEDTNIKSLVSKLSYLQDPELRRQLGLNGMNAVKNQYNWDNDAIRLLDGVNTYASSTSRSSRETAD